MSRLLHHGEANHELLAGIIDCLESTSVILEGGCNAAVPQDIVHALFEHLYTAHQHPLCFFVDGEGRTFLLYLYRASSRFDTSLTGSTLGCTSGKGGGGGAGRGALATE